MRKMHLRIFAAVCIVSLLAAGCTAPIRKIYIETFPPEVKVKVLGTDIEEETPCHIKLKADDTYKIKLSKAGYEDKTVDLLWTDHAIPFKIIMSIIICPIGLLFWFTKTGYGWNTTDDVTSKHPAIPSAEIKVKLKKSGN